VSSVVSLEWAKKLKEAGYPQDSSKERYYRKSDGEYTLGKEKTSFYYKIPDYNIAAPCGCELLEQLHEYTKVQIGADVDGKYSVIARQYDMYWSNESLADACAMMYVWLHEEGYL